MKGKNLSYQSNNLLGYFIDKNQHWLNYAKALKALPGASESAVLELLSDMTRRGLLMRVKNGVYYIIPFDQDPQLFMPDWHLLAEPLVKGNKYYIGYYSALQIHELTTQPSSKEYIVVDNQIKPAVTKIKEVSFQFVYHNSKHFFGMKKIWVDSFHKVPCSDLEKTFIDCLFKPEYAGGIVEVSKALYKAKTKIDYNRLLEYCKQFDSQAVIKRLGFLMELLNINNQVTEELQKLKTNSYVVLDTELPKEGKRTSRWNIQQNLDSETIQSAILT
jgi:predicted transcriptional regulator of viral defense system